MTTVESTPCCLPTCPSLLCSSAGLPRAGKVSTSTGMSSRAVGGWLPGRIPPSWASHKSLKTLLLTDNELTGKLDQDFTPGWNDSMPGKTRSHVLCTLVPRIL
jgi:hypothetical protein